MPRPLPKSIDETQELLASSDYVAERSLATALYLALAMQRPLFLEGEAGVGKTEIAKVIAQALGRELIRLQCYEGLDIAQAAYEWNYSRQMIEIRLAEAAGEKSKEKLAQDIFSERFLVKRPLARALEGKPGKAPVLLIDELDRTDEPFEAYLLEVLSDWQISIPETGTLRASEPPIVVITSNRTREIHDAVKRRCFYHWVDYPDAARELEILRRKAPKASAGPVQGGGRLRAAAARRRAVQAAGGRRDHRLGELPGGARSHRARPGDGQQYARRAAQVPGRHREDRRRGSHAPGRRIQGRGHGLRRRRCAYRPSSAGCSAPRRSAPREAQARARQLRHCRALLSERGEAAGTALARQALDACLALEGAEREALFDALTRDFSPEPERVGKAADAYRRDPGPTTLIRLQETAEPPRQELFRRLNMAPGGTAAVVELRRRLLAGTALRTRSGRRSTSTCCTCCARGSTAVSWSWSVSTGAPRPWCWRS